MVATDSVGRVGISEKEYWSLSLEEKVRVVDPALTFVGSIGYGSYANVAKVERGDELFALKVNYCLLPMDHEYSVLCDLSGIKGIPVPYQLYETAILMEYIDGVTLSESEQGGLFFRKLRGVVDDIHGIGYSLPRDFHGKNVMVDKNCDPWVVDFMYAYKLEDNPESDLIIRDRYNLMGLERSYRKGFMFGCRSLLGL